MRVFVTGAAGFIGSTLVDRLLASGHQVVAIDNLSTGTAENLCPAALYNNGGARHFTFVPLDVQAPELTDVVEGAHPEVVFHLAAHADPLASLRDPQFDARTNVMGTINVCEASRKAGVRRIVYAASHSGMPSCLPASGSSEMTPFSTHFAAKLAGELYLCAYAATYRIEPIILALASVYGPRQCPYGDAGVITSGVKAWLNGRQVEVGGDIGVARDYVYVDDVVEAFMRAAAAPAGVGGRYSIGSGQRITVFELRRLIAEALESTEPQQLTDEQCPGQIEVLHSQISSVENEFGWKPAVGFVDGVQRTIDWMCAGPASSELATA